MNNTKWRELRLLMLEQASFSPRYRVKVLRARSEAGYYWDGEWYYHLPTYKEIEWLEIDPVRVERSRHLVPDKREDRTDELTNLLRSRSIPFEVEGTYLRIYGYRRPGRRQRRGNGETLRAR